MAYGLAKRIGLTPSDETTLAESAGNLKDLGEFLSDAADAAKGTDLAKAIETTAPWAKAVGDAFGDVLPPVKLLIGLFERLTKKTDPNTLGHLACTIAYQRAIEQAVKAVGGPTSTVEARKRMEPAFAALAPDAEINFLRMTFGGALQHPFVKHADSLFLHFAGSVGYGEAAGRTLIEQIHKRFVVNLKTILSHGDLRERFAPFTQAMMLGTGDHQAYEALIQHADHQRWLFEEAPVLDSEPFALAHVYIPTQCGVLTWKQITDGARSEVAPDQIVPLDPFSEQHGGRQPLLEAVMALIADGSFRDAIVVQGAAGAGKSSFTLRLCAELVREGLRPIRVRLRDLRLDRTLPLLDALSPAVRLGPDASPPDDLFLNGAIFKESIVFRGTSICPYVLVLDGWDEINISAAEGFRMRVERMLEQVRSEFLLNREVPVRVILTGRPSSDVSESMFFRKETRVLTIRSMSPAHLEGFVKALKEALDKRPVCVDSSDPWIIGDLSRFNAVFKSYREDFNRVQRSPEKAHADHSGGVGQDRSSTMEVLGFPLLAHIAVRLMNSWQGDLRELVQNPTMLYRSLVDLTCEKSGQPEHYDLDPSGRPRIAGPRLRDLLWRTAAAMTAHGKESISHRELELRLRCARGDLEKRTKLASEEHVLSNLMISFYFKGGHRDLGCEFIHKSFREYLFAEGIVETLKAFGRDPRGSSLPERQCYWQDFDPSDPRYPLRRELSYQLAPQWLKPEVVAHLQKLLGWEIERAVHSDISKPPGMPTERLDLDGWKRVRDALADLWDWWAEAVHLRPQPRFDDRGQVAFEPAFVEQLIKHAMPYALEADELPTPPRSVSKDAHLGDGLCRLCAWVHDYIAIVEGWLRPQREGQRITPEEAWRGVSSGEGPRRHQSEIVQARGRWIVFRPSGRAPPYLANYMGRINGAGWRPDGPFPSGVALSGADLRKVDLHVHVPATGIGPGIALSHANLSEANMQGGVLPGASLVWAFAQRANFEHALLEGTLLLGADFKKSNFRFAVISGANLDGANLLSSDLSHANLQRTILANANLSQARLDQANLLGSYFDNTRMGGATYEGAQLDPGILAQLTEKQSHVSSLPRREGEAEQVDTPKPSRPR